MTKFTLSLLTAAAVAGLCGADSMAGDLLSKIANSSPNMISSSRAEALNDPDSRATLRKTAKKHRVKSSGRKAVARFAEEADESIIYSCSCDFLTEGSETEPAELELDDWDNIPEELIGEENYGFGGQGLMQAGGALYVPFEYAEDPDEDDPWMMDGLFWTPDIYEPMEVTIELDAKIAEGCDVETDEYWVYASDYIRNFAEDSAEISTEWKHITLEINANDFVPESEDDSYYFTLFTDGGADVLVKNVTIRGKKAELQVPVAEGYTDFTGSSFTAHWSEVEGATGYYLSVYNFDPTTKTNTSVVLDKQFTEDNFHNVTDLTPGNFYSYQVAATNGSFTTSESNFVLVCELVPPTGVTLAAGEDNKSLVADWKASPGANYYVLTVNSTVDVKAGQTVMLANADFSDVESTGTVAQPEESEYWYETRPELPGWEFNLGCSAPGAFGFMDNAQYTAMVGLAASLSSMDYDLSNAKEGKVNLSIEAASPGNGMIAGLLTFNESENKYGVAAANGTSDNVPEDFAPYSFDFSGVTERSQFLIITRTSGNTDGAILIRKLQLTAEANADGTFGIPVGTRQTADTKASVSKEIEDEVTYSAVVVPYLVNDNGSILAIGKASEPVIFKPSPSGIASLGTAEEGTVRYFNLQGQKIDNPAKGTVVIKVNGTTTTKSIF